MQNIFFSFLTTYFFFVLTIPDLKGLFTLLCVFFIGVFWCFLFPLRINIITLFWELFKLLWVIRVSLFGSFFKLFWFVSVSCFRSFFKLFWVVGVSLFGSFLNLSGLFAYFSDHFPFLFRVVFICLFWCLFALRCISSIIIFCTARTSSLLEEYNFLACSLFTLAIRILKQWA